MQRRLIPPYRGAANNTPHTDTPETVCPPGNLSDVRPVYKEKGRPTIGQRPGIVKAFGGVVLGNGGPIAGVGTISRARGSAGYDLGSAFRVRQSVSLSGGTTNGQIWGLRPNFGTFLRLRERVDGSGPYVDTGPATHSVNAVTITPDGTRAVIASNYTDASTKIVSRVTCIDLSTGAVQWSRKISQTGLDRYTNTLVCDGLWVFVCNRNFVVPLKLSSGAPPDFGSTEYALNGWGSEALAAIVDGSSLYVLMKGSSAGATLPSGVTVTAGSYAVHFRSGILKYTIGANGYLSAQTLTAATWAAKLVPGNRYYEAAHGYLRFSEQITDEAPRGLFPTCFCRGSLGGFIVGHGNAGWGPDGNPAHTSPRDYVPASTTDTAPTTVSRFNAAGGWEWSADTDSIINEVGEGGFFNDLPLTDSALTSITAVASHNGRVFAAGRSNAAGVCVFAMDEQEPSLRLWSQDLGGPIREAAIAINPQSGRLVCVGDRNNSWTGATGQRHLWELDPVTGAILRTFDIGNASGLGVACTPGGDTIYVSDYV